MDYFQGIVADYLSADPASACDNGVTPSIASMTRLITRPSIAVGVMLCTTVIMTTAT